MGLRWIHIPNLEKEKIEAGFMPRGPDLGYSRKKAVVFVVDVTRSMGHQITKLIQSIEDAADKKYPEVVLGLVTFGATTHGWEIKKHQWTDKDFTNDSSVIGERLKEFEKTTGGGIFVPSVEALVIGCSLQWPEEYKNRVVVLFTDSPPFTNSLSNEVIESAMSSAKISRFCVVSVTGERDIREPYWELIQFMMGQTEGLMLDIDRFDSSKGLMFLRPDPHLS